MDCAVRKKNTKRVGTVLTYDTALQAVAGSAQKDLLLNLSLLGRHFIGLLFLARVEATGKRWEVGGAGKAEAGAGMARGESRTSCGSVDDTKEENGGIEERRYGGAHQTAGRESIEIDRREIKERIKESEL